MDTNFNVGINRDNDIGETILTETALNACERQDGRRCTELRNKIETRGLTTHLNVVDYQ
jgi:hypothetical protein